jgi:hypothetical protein
MSLLSAAVEEINNSLKTVSDFASQNWEGIIRALLRSEDA